MSIDWRDESFQKRLDLTTEQLSEHVEFSLRDLYSDVLDWDEIAYIANEVGAELSTKIIQVMRKGLP